MVRSLSRASRWIPTRCVALLLELRASHEGLSEVPGILEHQRVDQIGGATIGDHVEVLGQDSVFTERHAVLVDVTRSHLSGRDLQRSGSGLPALSAAAAATRSLPL